MITSSSSSRSSSLHPSSPSPPIRYFDLLPPELLRLVVDSVDNFPIRKQKERRFALRSLCRTSKLLRSLAQPFLLKDLSVYVGTRKNVLKLFLERTSDVSIESVERLSISIPRFFDEDNRLQTLAEKAVNLREVYLHHVNNLLTVFVGTNITTLSLSWIRFSSEEPFFIFPQVINLSLFRCNINGSFSHSLPKLKHLAFVGDGATLTQSQYDFLDRVVPSLISLTTSLRLLPALPPSIFASASLSTLFDTAELPSTLGDVKNLQISQVFDDGKRAVYYSAEVRSIIRKWTDFILRSTHRLEVVYLAFNEGGGGVDPELKSVCAALARACQSTGIEVVWEKCMEEFSFTDIVPASFIKKSEAHVMVARES